MAQVNDANDGKLNPYEIPRDYFKLAENYPPLKRYVYAGRNGEAGLNFKDPKAVRELNKAYLFIDFGLQVDISLNSLCPLVPSRLSYVLWIEELLSFEGGYKKVLVYGMDIGTGAVCIYPLLACKRNENWKMFATDIQKNSIDNATLNVKNNNFSERISLKLVEEHENFFKNVPFETLHFTMCNPPFYASDDEVLIARQGKLNEPLSVCTGNQAEMITIGGEFAFITKMFKDSKEYIESHNTSNSKCWFTSLVGLKRNYEIILRFLQDNNDLVEIKSTRFTQGKTTRYLIAWQFKK